MRLLLAFRLDSHRLQSKGCKEAFVGKTGSSARNLEAEHVEYKTLTAA
jgi:hypothetical protein